MVQKVKVGYLVPIAVQRQLRALAERDQRSLSGEVAWLVGREWRRHMLSLGPRRVQWRQPAQRMKRAQRLRRAAAEDEEPGGAYGEL